MRAKTRVTEGRRSDDASTGRRRATTVEPTLIVLIVALVGLGFFLTGDFGKSWDEYVHVVYADQTIENYEGTRSTTDTLFNLRYYGPFYSVLVEGTVGILTAVVPGWNEAEARHFLYYLAFVLAVAGVVALARRFVGRPAALAAGALFASQPVLFGHGFINPKDTPFMGFFIAAVWAGTPTTQATAL